MREVTIEVRRSGNLYAAQIKEEKTPFSGSSPDEALGHLVRERWLDGTFDELVKIELDIRSDEPIES